MTPIVPRPVAARQAQPTSQAAAGEGQPLSPAGPAQGQAGFPDVDETGLELSLLRAALAEDHPAWTHEALVAHGLPVSSAAYVSRMLSGEKAWTLRHTSALPREIRIAYHARALRREGVLVVQPVPGDQATEAFVAGLFGMVERFAALASALPARAAGQVKAHLPTGVERRRQA